MATDVVAKLDAWLKRHNQGAHDDHLEDSIHELRGIATEMYAIGGMRPKQVRAYAEEIRRIVEQLELAQNASECAS